jgi:hypothetical protein
LPDDATDEPDDVPSRRPRRLIRRITLAAAMTVVALNIWTGSPLLALWVGAQIQRNEASLQMSSVGIVMLTLGLSVFVLYRALEWLNSRYGEAVGRKPGTRRPAPWLKSVSGERTTADGPREPLTAAERIMVLVSVLAIGLFEVWFFFLAGSSLPNQ